MPGGAGNAQNYLIAFLATLQGDKQTIAGMKSMEMHLNKAKKASGLFDAQNKKTGKGLGMLAVRALAVIPIWMALRSVYMGLFRAVGNMITANIDLEEGMARIRTVVEASSKSIEGDMAGIKRAILDVALDTRVPLKDLAETFYFLRTSNLDTEEAMAGFLPTVNAMVGTMNNAKDTARAVAGIYNTMGDALGNNLSVHEKFQKIADVLTFTYATQDVQLGELTQSYTKLAPYITGLSDSFVEIITLLGFLNTRLLRAGRTGRLTGRAILQLTKNSDKLADVFGITFDPNAPIAFLKIMEEISKQVTEAGGLTASQGQKIQEVFATRASTVVRLLISDFDDLKEAINLAEGSSKGFAERMREIKETTTKAQLERLSNIIAVLSNEFLSGASASGNFAVALKEMNDNLAENRQGVRDAGLAIGFYVANLQLLIEWIEKLDSSTNIVTRTQQDFMNQFFKTQPFFQHYAVAIDALSASFAGLFKVFGISREDFLKEEQKKLETYEKEQGLLKSAEKLQEDITAEEQQSRATLKQIQAEIKHQVKLLKLVGASELEIAVFRKEALELEKAYMQPASVNLELRKRNLKIIEAGFKVESERVKLIQSTQLQVMKVLGASELQVLQIKEKQLLAFKGITDQTQLQRELDKNRLQQQVAFVKEKQKEANVVAGLYQQYAQADEFDRERIKRAIELVSKKPYQIAFAYKKSDEDRKIIDAFFGNFSKEAQDRINKIRKDMFDLGGDLPRPGGALDLEQQIPNEIIGTFWNNWEVRGLQAIDVFKQKWLEVNQSVKQLAEKDWEDFGQATAGASREHSFDKKVLDFALSKSINDSLPFLGGRGQKQGALSTRRQIQQSQVNVEVTVNPTGTNIEEWSEEVKQAVKRALEDKFNLKKIAKEISPDIEVE